MTFNMAKDTKIELHRLCHFEWLLQRKQMAFERKARRVFPSTIAVSLQVAVLCFFIAVNLKYEYTIGIKLITVTRDITT